MDYILRFGVTLIELHLFRYFAWHFQDEKNKIDDEQYFHMLLQAFLCAGVHVFHNNLLSLAAILIAILAQSIFIEESASFRIAAASTFIAISMVMQYLMHIVYYLLKFDSQIPADIFESLEILGYVIAQGAIVISMCKLYGNRQIRIKALSKKLIQIMIAYSIMEVISCSIIMYNVVKNASRYVYVNSFVVMNIMVALYYFALYFMSIITKYIERQYADKEYIAELMHERKKADELRVMRHDMKNKLMEYRCLLETDDIDKLKEVLNAEFVECNHFDSECYTSNVLMNSVLRSIVSKAKGNGIQVDTEIEIPENIYFANGDMGILFGNLVDNAIEACMKLEQDERYISIHAKVIQGSFYIKVENSKTDQMVDYLRTSKEDTLQHGIGVRSIMRIFDKYDGNVKFEDKGNSFKVKGYLNIGEKRVKPV